jgi:para-aminobenzoate synthetase component 1
MAHWKTQMISASTDDVLKQVVPLNGVHTETLNLSIDFVDLAARFAHLPGTVVLLSGGDLDCTRYHFLGVHPWLTLSGRQGRSHLQIDDHSLEVSCTPLDLLERLLERLRLPADIRSVPMEAGLMGYLAYDLKDDLEQLPRTCVDDSQLPSLLLYAPSILVIHDRLTGVTRLAIPRSENRPEEVEARRRHFFETVAAPFDGNTTFRTSSRTPVSNFTRSAYEDAVRRVIDYIAAGDVYQVNLSQRFQTAFEGDGFTLFRHLFELNPAPFFAYIQAGDHQIVSTSPERFLLRNADHVEARPIKGTRPRGSTPVEDERMRNELPASPKDDAELSMIVDLLRNDIGRACAPGSVRVARHKRLETYANVYHLVSIVEGRLDADQTSVDLLRATFPGGSITGCPKVRAMEIIDELETCRRHVYCGSIGYLSFHDTMDLSIAIRTATIINGTLCYSVGGGIVYDSDPGEEFEETLHKGRSLAAACSRDNASLSGDRSTAWLNGRLIPAADAVVPANSPGLQYGHGFFETLRADNGVAPLLADHLARLEKSWHALMPGEFPDITWTDVIAQVLSASDLEAGTAAVKILVARGTRQTPPWDHTLLVTARPYRHRLADRPQPGLHLGSYPHPRQSPLAAHKTLNYLYYLMAGQWAVRQGHDEAIIFNPDGTVSETNTANLLLISDRTVIRPASAAVLPGVMASAACRQLDAWGYAIKEDPVTAEQLDAAEQVLACNALMGAVPVSAIDHRPRPRGGDIWRRLNQAILPGLLGELET